MINLQNNEEKNLNSCKSTYNNIAILKISLLKCFKKRLERSLLLFFILSQLMIHTTPLQAELDRDVLGSQPEINIKFFNMSSYKLSASTLAALNFTLGTIIKHLDFNDPIEQSYIKKLQTARNFTRAGIDMLKIKNHNDWHTGIPWLISDLISSINMISSNGNALSDKPPYKLFGVIDAIEAASIIYASYIQPEENAPGNATNLSNLHNAWICCNIHSLSRLLGKTSSSKFLIVINCFMILHSLNMKKLDLETFSSNLFPEDMPINTLVNRLEEIEIDYVNNILEGLTNQRRQRRKDIQHNHEVATNARKHLPKVTINWESSQVTINRNGTLLTLEPNSRLPLSQVSIAEVLDESSNLLPNERNILILPCNHPLEEDGSAQLIEGNNPLCPICRTEIAPETIQKLHIDPKKKSNIPHLTQYLQKGIV